MSENKKVIGATECELDGIKFKSKWECKVYQMLKEADLNPQYEGLKIYFQEKNINYIDAKVGCTVGIHSGIKPCGIFLFEK